MIGFIILALVGLFCGLCARDWVGPRLPRSVMLARLQSTKQHTLYSWIELKGEETHQEIELQKLRQFALQDEAAARRQIAAGHGKRCVCDDCWDAQELPSRPLPTNTPSSGQQLRR